MPTAPPAPSSEGSESTAGGLIHWLFRGRSPVWILLFLSVAATAWIAWKESALPQSPWTQAAQLGDNPADAELSPLAIFYHAASRYVLIWLALALPAFVLATMRRGGRLPQLGVWLLFLSLIALIIPGDILKNWQAVTEQSSGELPSKAAYLWKLALMTGALLLPPLLYSLYRRQSILGRYVTRSFVVPLFFCLVAFVAIWLLMDLGDNFTDYRDKNAGLFQIARIYLIQIPMLMVEVLPVALLLATLYSLGRLSRSNELTAMMSAGKSILSIIKPFLVAAGVATVLCLILNYHWAPRAAGLSESMVENIGAENTEAVRFKDHVYRNTADGRTWFIGRVPFDLNLPFRDVMLFEESKEGNLSEFSEAGQARWVPKRRHWVLANGRRVAFPAVTDEKNLERARMFGSNTPGKPNSYIVRTDLSETPWQILSSTLKAEQLSVPELLSYESANLEKSTDKQLAPYRTHFWLRFAQPFKCLVLVLIAAPLGIVLSRRGFLGGIAVCIVVFFVMLFMENLFMNLGVAGHLPPVIAAWAPYVVTGLIGLVMLYYRVRQRDIPSLNPLKWIRNKNA